RCFYLYFSFIHNSADSIFKELFLNCRSISEVIINSANVSYNISFVCFFKQINMRSSGGSILWEDFLLFVKHIGKRKVFLFCAFLHIFKTVTWRNFGIIWINGYYRETLFRVSVMQLYHPVFIGYHIRASITAEYHNKTLG